MKGVLLKILSIVLCVVVLVALFVAMTRTADITVVAESENLAIGEVDSDMQSFIGKNIIGFDKNAFIAEITEKHPYVKVTSVVKKFPNQLLVGIRERKPYFAIKSGINYALVDEEGYVLELSQDPDSVDGYCLLDTSDAILPLGKPVEDVDALITVMKTAYKLGYICDRLNAIAESGYVSENVLVLKTKTGVELCIDDYVSQTVLKTQYLFSAYVACSDARKLSGKLISYVGADGRIVCTWTK